MTVVLDASALLALILGERGADRVAGVMADAVISAVNMTETLSRLADLGVDATEAAAALADRTLQVVDFDAGQAVRAAQLRALTRHLGLSLGDRCCLALAGAHGARVMTADPAWAGLEVGIEIEVIR